MKYLKTYTFTDTGIHQTVTNYLITKEQYILDTYPFIDDFGTNYTDTNITTRTGAYNVFSMDCKELSNVLTFIKTSFNDFVTNVKPASIDWCRINDPAVSAWLYIVKSSETPNTHKHSVDVPDNWSFVSGIYCLSGANTTTVFSNKTETLSTNNIDRILTLFPPFYHYYNINNVPGTEGMFIYLDIFFSKSSSQGDVVFYNNLVSLV